VLAVIACTLLNFFFTLAEASLVTMGRLRIGFGSFTNSDDSAIPDDNRSSSNSQTTAAIVDELFADPTKIIAAVQVAITVFSLCSLAIALIEFTTPLANWLGHWIHIALARKLAVAFWIIFIAIINLVIGEIVPRAIAAKYPNEVGKIVATPLRWLEIILRPLVAVLLAISNILVKPFGMTASFNSSVMTEDELKVILEAGQNEGVIEEDEKEMLHNVISFGDTQAHEVMTPRVDICGIEMNQPLSKLIYLIVDHGHSRIPVYKETIDTIVGIIHAKDLLPSVIKGEKIDNLLQIMREPTFVPEHLPIDDLLTQMRRSNTQLAIVQDEYGGTAGLITIEDLIEEIVGEIQDEYDPEQKMVETDLQTGASLVDARMTIDDVNEELNLSLPTVDFDTIGGLVFGLIGRPPEPGDTVDTTVGADGELTVRFQVTKADGRRLQQVSIESFPTPSDVETVSQATVPVN
jgi:putative hemolysin